MRAPARKPRWLNPAPCTAAKGMYLVGARKHELPQRSSGAVDVTWKRNGGEHARSFVRISRVFISSTKCVVARVASAANRPPPNATGGQKTLPMWTFLAINPRAGRNSRRYPRKFSSARCKTKPTCRLRPA